MRRGFAIIYAITALFLLGALASVVTVGVNMRARELQSAAVEAQLRQVIIAGAQLSREGVVGEVALPPELSSDASLRVVADEEDPRIEASFLGGRAICPIPR